MVSFASFVLSVFVFVVSIFVQIRECCYRTAPKRRHILRVRWGLIMLTPFLTFVQMNCAIYFILEEETTNTIVYTCLIASALNLLLRLFFSMLKLGEKEKDER